MYIDAYLNRLKLTRSDGRKTVVNESSSRPEDNTINNRRMPAWTPIITPATPMLAAAMMEDSAMIARVVSKP